MSVSVQSTRPVLVHVELVKNRCCVFGLCFWLPICPLIPVEWSVDISCLTHLRYSRFLADLMSPQYVCRSQFVNTSTLPESMSKQKSIFSNVVVTCTLNHRPCKSLSASMLLHIKVEAAKPIMQSKLTVWRWGNEDKVLGLLIVPIC